MTEILRRFGIVSLLFLVFLSNAFAQNDSDRIKGIDRWSFRINAAEVMATVPNIGLEFDLSSSPFNRSTLGLSLKHNWFTKHTLPPYIVFNMSEIRPEYRYYWRNESKPLSHAFFVGAYLQADWYSIKAGENGIQGPLYGFGALWGQARPLYSYKRINVDFEWGFALGLGVTKYSAYKLNESRSFYISVHEKDRGFHIIPIFSEIKCTFILRTTSIADKYKKLNQAAMIRKMERKEQRQSRRENLRRNHHKDKNQ